MEIVTAIVGPRGSGKSIHLCQYGCMMLNDGVQTISNMPIKTVSPSGKEIKSEDVKLLPFMLSNNKKGYCLLVDEMQFIASGRRAMSNKNMFVNIYSTQLRKDQASLAFTVQNFMWVDPYFRFQVDVLVKCRDLYLTDYGRENDLERGTLICLMFYDLSGLLTPDQAFVDMYGNVQGRPFSVQTLHAKELWNAFDTYRKSDIDEIFNKYEIEAKTYEVSKEAPEDAERYAGGTSDIIEQFTVHKYPRRVNVQMNEGEPA